MKDSIKWVAACLLLAGCNVSPQDKSMSVPLAGTDMNDAATVAPGNDTVTFATTSAGQADEYYRFFTQGIRTEGADGSGHSAYICFTPDSLSAELFMPGSVEKVVLERHTLASGAHVWNIEDDDTYNVRCTNGCWIVSRRNQVMFRQSPGDNDYDLGAWREMRYEGLFPATCADGAKYRLYIRHREHSGDGHFMLHIMHAKPGDGNDTISTYTGRRYTFRGTTSNPDAIVWQLKCDNDNGIYDFLYDPVEQTLTALGKER